MAIAAAGFCFAIISISVLIVSAPVSFGVEESQN